MFYFSDCEERRKFESCIYSFAEEMTRVWGKREEIQLS
jgi:hypothetical protein